MSGSPFAHLCRETSVRAVTFGRLTLCRLTLCRLTLGRLTLGCLTLGLLMASFAGGAHARHRQDAPPPPLVLEASPALAPFQHVRFCQRYPSDCKSDPAEIDRIELNAENVELLKSVNHDINASIVSTVKSHGAVLADGWTIAPSMGDCNDYAVTKRHVLLQRGLPAKALRLSAVTTGSGTGHLVLLIVTTRGELVLDNLTDAILPWQSTDYHWLKIQSARDARFWFTVRSPGPSVSQADRKASKPPARAQS
jgi:predicted transglutaminase-like cysteine proteinase